MEMGRSTSDEASMRAISARFQETRPPCPLEEGVTKSDSHPAVGRAITRTGVEGSIILYRRALFEGRE